jgi:hypothetical protein
MAWLPLPEKIQGELRSMFRAEGWPNFPTKSLRSKRRSSPCIFQVVVYLYQSKAIYLFISPNHYGNYLG